MITSKPNTPKSILVAEDDKKTATLISTYLSREGFLSKEIHDGGQVLNAISQTNPSLLILDLTLPNLDGWEICRQLRTYSDLPILILSARQEEIDRVLGLTLGADDYLVKPFSPRELVARAKAILRRMRLLRTRMQTLLQHGELLLDKTQHKVTKNKHDIGLTPSEFELLAIMMKTPGQVFSRQDLLDQIYPQDEDVNVVDRAIDVHIGNIRRKIEREPTQPQYIHTVRGLGYCFIPRTS